MTPDLEAKVLELGAALRRHTQEEPEHERVIREQMRTAEFAADVLSAWDEQVMHRGRRARHGLSQEHAAYARRVHAWAWYAVECALKAVVLCGEGRSARALGHSIEALTGPALVRLFVLWPGSHRYGLPSTAAFDSLRTGWVPDMRYDATATTDDVTARTWLAGAEHAVVSVLLPAILDGVVTTR